MQELKKKLSENLKKIEIWKRIRFLIIVLAIALFACHPYLNKMVIYSHDIGYHLNRINEICKQLIMGNFPATIHTELVNGLGYANSLFYPELFLYIPAMLIYFLKIDLLTSYKFFIVIITFFTFLSMYYSSILIFKKKQIAWLSALLYTFSLYRLTDIYVRGALGEILALVFFPLIISGLYEIIFGENKRWWVVVIGLFGLANSHILSFVMAIPIILILCLANIDKIFKDKNILKHLFIAAIVAIITTIGFFGPLIEQKCNDKFFVDEQTIDEPSDLKERATSIDLALRNQLKMGDGINGNYTDETLSEGVGIILLMLPILILFKKGISYKNNRFEIQILVIAFITYMISTKLFPWEKIEFLTIIQFPFRLNIIPTTLLALVAADAFYNFMREKNDTTTLLTIVILLILAGASIAMLTGENGLLGKAKESKERTSEANAKERVQLEVQGSYNKERKISLSLLNENLKGIEGLTHGGKTLDENPIEELPTEVELDGYKIEIKGESQEKEEFDDIESLPMPSSEAVISKIPGEYENINEGIVIYIIPTEEQNTVDWTADTNSNDILDVQEKYDQFVWVPVPNPVLDLSADTEVEEDLAKIIKRKNITTKPMDEEEAILQMELLNHDFFVFKNVDEECVSVIYKRKDNDYGIINVK